MQTGVKHFAVAGLVPFSTLDLPGRLSAVLFTQGCPLRCRYCHNPHLQPRAGTGPGGHDWGGILAWLQRRVGLLDAVVVSGGEPLMQLDLPDVLAEIRALGFATALHSAGTLPRQLSKVLPLLDWIGLDVKAPEPRHEAVTGRDDSYVRVQASLDLVLASGVAYELRTTVHPDLLNEDDLAAIAADLHARGVRRWVLQRFRPDGCCDEALARPTTHDWTDALPALRRLVPDIELR